MNKNYGGLIWTNHALQRLRDRGISQSDALGTWRNPDESRYAKTKGAWVYYKNLGTRKIEVVAKQNERKEWVVLTVWSKEPGQYFKKNPQKSLWRLLLDAIFR